MARQTTRLVVAAGIAVAAVVGIGGALWWLSPVISDSWKYLQGNKELANQWERTGIFVVLAVGVGLVVLAGAVMYLLGRGGAVPKRPEPRRTASIAAPQQGVGRAWQEGREYTAAECYAVGSHEALQALGPFIEEVDAELKQYASPESRRSFLSMAENLAGYSLLWMRHPATDSVCCEAPKIAQMRDAALAARGHIRDASAVLRSLGMSDEAAIKAAGRHAREAVNALERLHEKAENFMHSSHWGNLS